MTDTSDIQRLQQEIALADSLALLKVNVDFKRVLKHYTESLPLSLVSQLANHLPESNEYKGILNQLNAISHFKQFLDSVIEQGQWAKDELFVLQHNPDGDD